jgi:hypothetical protein
MEDTIVRLGRTGSIQRALYNALTGAIDTTTPGAKPFTLKMALVPQATIRELEGSFVSQRYVAVFAKKTLLATGWPNGRPQKEDLIVAEGQALIVEHVTEKGFEDMVFYYCQCVG